MKKGIFFALFAILIVFLSSSFSLAHNMEGSISSGGDDNHTAEEEAEGAVIWERLKAKEIKCNDLTDDDFASLGEYYMGQMVGSSHEAMNNMMTRMMGKEREEQMHVAMGKRRSNCESEATMFQNIASGRMMPMMMGGEMMGGGANPMMGNFGASPMGWFGFGWIFMILFWIFVIVGIIFLIKWLVNQSKSETKGKSALDILKERYAKGEIDKKEFEEKKKDLV